MRRRHDSIVGRADYGSSSSFSTTESDSDISSCESSIAKKAKRQLTVATQFSEMAADTRTRTPNFNLAAL